jgi:hypothetical protein
VGGDVEGVQGGYGVVMALPVGLSFDVFEAQTGEVTQIVAALLRVRVSRCRRSSTLLRTPTTRNSRLHLIHPSLIQIDQCQVTCQYLRMLVDASSFRVLVLA